jgi:hypothetical protein
MWVSTNLGSNSDSPGGLLQPKMLKLFNTRYCTLTKLEKIISGVFGLVFFLFIFSQIGLNLMNPTSWKAIANLSFIPRQPHVLVVGVAAH